MQVDILAGSRDRGRRLGAWHRWTEVLWQEAEATWLHRDGQDAFYRKNVVVPALINKISYMRFRHASLVDIGAGDGKCTSTIVNSLHEKNFKLNSIHLVDKSIAQLKVASRDKKLKHAKIYVRDINKETWSTDLDKLRPPKIIFCIFVIQELAELSVFARGLGYLMRPGDIAFIVTVAPVFSYLLRQKSLIKCTDYHNYPDDRDWKWAGGYPIDGQAGSFHLPHFQRTAQSIRRALHKADLIVDDVEFLKVTKTKESKRIFMNTVYSQLILYKPSSMLITCRPKELCEVF